MIKKVLIVRHGDYNGNNRLSEYGEEQMTELAKFIKTNLNGCSIAILSSTAPRASDSARVLAEFLGIDFEEHEELWDDNRHRGNTEKSYEIINATDADIVVAVTHLEFTEYIPRLFIKNLGIRCGCSEIGKGKAWEIDLEKQTIEHAPR